MSKIYLATFTGNSLGASEQANLDLVERQRLLNRVALELGVADEIIAWTWQDLLTTKFYRRNKSILDQTRGGGFWSWKPYIILKSLDKLGVDDWLVYSDIGKPFRRNDPSRAGNANIGNVLDTPFDDAIRYAKRHKGFTPGVWIPHYGAAKVWCKRDCFVGMSCDSSEFHNSGQVQAGYSIWSNTPEARDFLTQWLAWCERPEIVSDQENIYGKPNFDEFRDHRHDQAILSNLVIKQKIELFGPRDKSLVGYRDFNMILRHMMLADSLHSKSAAFSTMFKAERDELPSWLHEPLQLWALASIELHNSVWVYHGGMQEDWEAAFPKANVVMGARRAMVDNKWPKNKFGAIFAHKFGSDLDQSERLEHLYQALTPGGLLLIGPFDGSAEDEANVQGSFNQLLKWIDVHQAFPHGMADIASQQRNGITLGNTLNPVIANGAQGKGGYAILRKPRVSLV